MLLDLVAAPQDDAEDEKQQTEGEDGRTLEDGTYSFGREDLPFIDLAERFSDEIPFHTLLKQINETHRKGLETGYDSD